MASIRKWRGQWQVRWRDPDGRQRSRLCPTKRAAEELAREIQHEVSLGRRWEPRAARHAHDIGETMTAYVLDASRTLAPNTAVRYGRALDLFRRYLGDDVGRPISWLSRDVLAGFWSWLALPQNGLHGQARTPDTCRKQVEVAQLMWRWAHDHEIPGVPPPRAIKMPRSPGAATVAPTWAEMDACVMACTGWRVRLAIVLRFTGLRVQQAMGLVWTDVDLDRMTLRVRGELGKSAQERRGRVVPMSRHLAQIMAGWGGREGCVVPSSRGGDRERQARPRDMERAWARAGVRPEAWEGRSHHAFRKGFVSGLKRAGADDEAVEYLVGHTLGLRGVYTDADALPLREAVDRVPAMNVEPVWNIRQAKRGNL
jgi:integrase